MSSHDSQTTTTTKKTTTTGLFHQPADQKELPHKALPPHGHEDVADGHALAETGHHPGLGQVGAQPLQQPVEAVLPGVAPDLTCQGFKPHGRVDVSTKCRPKNRGNGFETNLKLRPGM